MMFTEKLSMSSTISLPTCSCCHRAIMPNDKCVKFNCPACDDGDLIWRCESCREAARIYTCSSCDFQGP
jgi:Zn-ribbon RNA-binding protein